MDETVFGYLNCLGKVEKKKVILDTFKEGPLCGIQNGDRKYSVEFKADIDIGPLHVIDGHKVTFAYPGQRRTCFRCLQTASLWTGKRVAKECEAAGGNKVMLADHLLSFWAKIGYTPDKNQTTLLNEIESAEPAETDYQIGGSFTPKPVPAEKVSDDKFGGVSVKWFPKSSDHGAIVEFLVGNGLPQGHENVNIKENGQVIISLLDPHICRKMMTKINGKKFNKKNIYCNGIVPVSPKKGAQSSAQSQSSKTTNTEPKEANPTEAPPPPPTNSTVKTLVKELEKKKDKESFEDFDFKPVPPIKSKLFDDSDSDRDVYDEIEEKTNGWMSKKERKQKNKKNKRKAADSPSNKQENFKKADKKQNTN